MEIVNCNFCGADDSHLFLINRDRLLNKDDLFSLVQCNQCDLIYLNPRPSAQEIKAFYPDSYGVYTSDQTNPVLRWLKELLWSQDRALLNKYISDQARILEVGCGSGEYLAYMRDKAGWEVQGIEISPFIVEKAKQDYNLKVHLGTLTQTQLPEQAFDAVIMKYVLEHVHDPLESVTKISQILKPGGIFYFIIPDPDSWELKLFGKYWNGLDTPRHLFLFPRNTIEATLRKCGLVPVSTSYTVIPNDLILSLRFMLEDKGAPEALTRFVRWDNLLLIGLISPISFILGKIGKSGAMRMIAQKL